MKTLNQVLPQNAKDSYCFSAMTGIGFPILVNFKDIVLYHLRRFWKLIRTRKLDRHKMQHLYNLNTKIVLIMTFLLLLIGTLAIAAFEWNGSFAGMPVADKWTQAFFNATCPRTAGFSSVDLASLSVQTLLVYLFLMWVGVDHSPRQVV